jgi:hypothetical protein
MARYTIEISVLAPIDRDMCAFSIHTYHLLASPAVIAAAYTVIGLMRQAGYTNIAATCRRFAAQPALALELIGIALEN